MKKNGKNVRGIKGVKIMNFDKIKNMDKKEFERFLFNIQNTKQKFCVKCGNFTTDRITISVNKNGYNNRKLCNICQDCYSDMLDYLAISDID